MGCHFLLQGIFLTQGSNPRLSSLPHWPVDSFSSVQSLNSFQLSAAPCRKACQAFLSITSPQSLLKLMSIELVMPSNYLILWQILYHWTNEMMLKVWKVVKVSIKCNWYYYYWFKITGFDLLGGEFGWDFCSDWEHGRSNFLSPLLYFLNTYWGRKSTHYKKEPWTSIGDHQFMMVWLAILWL